MTETTRSCTVRSRSILRGPAEPGPNEKRRPVGGAEGLLLGELFAGAGADRDGTEVRRLGRARAELDHAKAVDAVRDLERVVQRLQHLVRRVELDEVVV